MKRFFLLGFLLLMAVDTFAQICFKFAGSQALPFEWSAEWLARIMTSPWAYGAVFGYICAFFTWMTLLRHVPVGPSFAASHLELVSVTLVSVWLFDEQLNVWKILGGLCILLGVLCLARGEQEEAHASPESTV